MSSIGNVLLTAITTIGGLVPLAAGFNINFYTLFSDFNPNIYLGSSYIKLPLTLDIKPDKLYNNYNKLKDYARAGKFLLAGNKLLDKWINLNINDEENLFNQIKSIYTKDFKGVFEWPPELI